VPAGVLERINQMAATTYTRILPDLTKATRMRVYERLIDLLKHLPSYGIDLLSVGLDVPTKTLTITLSDPVARQIDREHIGLEGTL
jgi:hypothetical protein